MSLKNIILTAYRALDQNDLEEAYRLVKEAETEISSLPDTEVTAQHRANLGGLMIDLGSWGKDEELITRGIQYAVEVLTITPQENHLVEYYYNVANGYSALWKMVKQNSFSRGGLDDALQDEKKYYRKAMELAHEQVKYPLENRELYLQLLINYANCLDSVGRSVEAITYYDRVLKRNPLMGNALGNKGITLSRLAPLVYGHQHLFYLEAHRLLSEALKRPIHKQARNTFTNYLDHIDEIIHLHDEMEAEQIEEVEPNTDFHDFLREFCAKHELYLTLTSLIGLRETMVYGDPFFISSMVAPLSDDKKFDRYVTFLNQIKQDYVLARYLLVQSQYRSRFVDVIDEGVLLFYPLDYSLHSSYIQMLKTALRLAVDVLDKIAFFIRDFYKVTSLSERDVNFRNLFSTKKAPLTLRTELAKTDNPFLFALLDVALDLRQEGYYDFIYERRNSLTHRVLVVYDFVNMENEVKDGIPRVSLSTFLNECIQAMQITRAAVMYLILMVDFEERRASNGGPFGIVQGTPVDGVLRWVPKDGED